MQNKKKYIKFSDSILEALSYCLKNDLNTYVVGEGVPDPKAIFGTTKGLLKRFGKNRILDMPVSEAGMTGIIIGSSLNGLRPILIHQRVDFMLLTMDQLANTAAKLSYIFNGQLKVPIVIRAIIGRGWGQSAQHSQSLESVFASFPGLKVISPSNAIEARNLLIASVKDNNPVIFLEHRWLHDTYSEYKPIKKIQLDGPKKIVSGTSLTIIGFSYSIIEILKANNILRKVGIKLEIIDLRILKPLNTKKIINSVKKTRRIIVVDNGFKEYGISSEIIAIITEKLGTTLKSNPIRLGINNHPTPSTKALIKDYYPDYKMIIDKVCLTLKVTKLVKNNINKILKKNEINLEIDIPNKDFKGPF